MRAPISTTRSMDCNKNREWIGHCRSWENCWDLATYLTICNCGISTVAYVATACGRPTYSTTGEGSQLSQCRCTTTGRSTICQDQATPMPRQGCRRPCRWTEWRRPCRWTEWRTSPVFPALSGPSTPVVATTTGIQQPYPGIALLPLGRTCFDDGCRDEHGA